jgi:putative ABC transport system substrate-binding protein
MKLRLVVCAVVVLGILVAPLAVDAQSSGKSSRIGILGPAEEPRFSDVAAGLKRGLRDHGYAEADTEILERRVGRGDRTGARGAVEELVRQRVAVLFVIGSELTRLAREVSAELPIVFVTPGDPVAAGVVASFAHPGGNTTAMTYEYPELSGKRLEILKETAPRARRVLVLYDSSDASPRQGVAAAREAAARLGLKLVEWPVRGREDLERGPSALAGADALLWIPGGFPSSHYTQIIRLAHGKRLPTIVHSRTKATEEALLSYGASDVATARQAARLVDKILKGAKAGNLPVERPMTLELTVNLRTAKVLGVTIPASVLIRADRVLE